MAAHLASTSRPPSIAAASRGILAGPVLLLALLLAAPVAPAAQAESWKQVGSDRGVTVWVQPDASRSVPRFRGLATIEAPLWQLLAIINDIPRYPEWNSRVATIRVLQRQADFRVQFYVRMKAPWPVDDRDAVLLTELSKDAGGDHVVASCHLVPGTGEPVPKRVVRFPRLQGEYRLHRLGPERTQVEYVVDADPGGWLPAWLVRYSVKAMPLDALLGLDRQQRRTRGTYDAFVHRNDPRSQPAATAPVSAE